MRKRVLLAALSGILLVLTFPDFNFEWLAWVALVPLFFAIDGQSPRRAFFLSYLSGVAFFLGTLYWLIHVTLPGMIVVALYLALYFGAFGAAASVFSRMTTSFFSLAAIPAAWVVIEWARAHLLTGFGWALLGHSQSFTPVVIQIADITGAYGVSFLIVLVNAALFITIKDWRAGRRGTGAIAVALLFVFIALAYGIVRTKNVFTGRTFRVAVVQGNIPQERKWDAAYREEILRTYGELTKEAAAGGADLIVWPETAVPGFLESDKDIFDRVTGLARDAGTPILLGTVREDAGGDYYNSACLISADGKIDQVYDKVHLVPFGEYIPFKKALAFVEKFAPVPIGDCSAGRELTVFTMFVRKGGGASVSAGGGVNWKLLKKVKFACLVCFEDIFPDLAREFVKRGAGFLVVITNDAWYKRSGAQSQHAQNSIFRAVENRVNVVRAANTGLSCFIDQQGRVHDPVAAGGDMYVSGFRARDIVLNRARTWYTLYGDVFVGLCAAIALAGLLKRRT